MSCNLNQKKKTAGFSILEVLILLFLTGIIFSVSFPALGAAVRKTEAQKQADAISAWLSTLHMKSLNMQKDLSVRLNNNELIAKDKNDKTIARKKISEKTTVRLSSSQIKFFASGVQSPTTIYLSHLTISCRIVLALRGRITTQCK
jgi:type II secretory pathway pseudopilin PulG